MGSRTRAGGVAVLAMALAACGGGEVPAGQDFTVAGGSEQAWPQVQGPQGDTGMLANMPAAPQGMPQAAPMQPMPPMPPPPDTRSLQPAQIVDQTGFSQPMVAANLQIPVGWQVVGGISWNDSTGCAGNMLQMGWSAIAPDSLTAIEKLPGFAWQIQGREQQYNPCPSAPFTSARQFLEATASRLRPGSQMIGYEDLTQVVQQQMQASGNSGQGRWDAGRIKIAYRDQGGVPMEEVLTAAVGFIGNSGGTAVVDAHRAPAGRLDMDLVQRVGATVQLDQQWAQAMQQRTQVAMQRHHDNINASINDWSNRVIAAQNARGAADRHAIRMRTNQEVSGIYSAIAINTSATTDRMHATTMSAVGEYNRYAGTDGSEVQSSIHGGSRVFQSNSDPSQAISTDDPYYNPSGATELERIP